MATVGFKGFNWQ